ncbi:helix-turn-helix transcriptional regulator [Massilia cavernae]|uniref:Transcriptional regulator n=1 Tax=Massilia cavernae TaxID=2320864 RepID=A0A418XXV6_9BURK|nr:helix-turn-helix transcriptional regulator [Massilia cavernae]RJG17783.1 transcriptional regulator [Massilia cavernae]
MPNNKLQDDQAALIDQVKQIAQGLAQTFAPFCEVLVHDLRDPKHAVLAVHNNLSGRATNDPATELGLARIADSNYPQILANYANQFADGRPAKSTSIGIKDAEGRYIAALCLNVDLTLFRSMQNALEQFNATDASPVQESLDPANAEAIRRRIDQYAAGLASSPQLLKAGERRVLMRELRDGGFLELRRAMEIAASHLGISRATAYNDIK